MCLCACMCVVYVPMRLYVSCVMTSLCVFSCHVSILQRSVCLLKSYHEGACVRICLVMQRCSMAYNIMEHSAFFAKEPLIIGLFCGKWPMKIYNIICNAAGIQHYGTFCIFRKRATNYRALWSIMQRKRATYYRALPKNAKKCRKMRENAEKCRKMPKNAYYATYCNATQCNTVQHSATQRNAVQHSATQCNRSEEHTSELQSR